MDRRAAGVVLMTVFRRLVAIVYFLEVGLLLLIVPWTGYLGRNFFTDAWPPLQAVVASGFVKGAISGLGLINLGAAVAEVVALVGGKAEDDDAKPADDGRT